MTRTGEVGEAVPKRLLKRDLNLSMPHKKAHKARAKTGDSCVTPFHVYVSSSVSGNTAAFSLSPSGLAGWSTRLTSLADSFTKFRFRSCKFRLRSLGVEQAAAYVAGVQDSNAFASIIAAMEATTACAVFTTQSVPSEWVNIPRVDLMGALPWYKSIAGLADQTEEAPGQILIRSTNATDIYRLEIKGVIEFAGSIPPANTPMEVQLLRQLGQERRNAVIARERASMLKVLSSGPPSAK